MTGTTNAAVTSLPWLVLVAAVGGTAHACLVAAPGQAATFRGAGPPAHHRPPGVG
ncbi:hypothetical protein [Parafrankia elaeagni]|uniref:hypothetical protein n=1 Tax=Parafrankia elaeagni TaxID=222534 RepID=UPI000364EAC0|nr:hypothetical protein [Parafrankia elaeagni]